MRVIHRVTLAAAASVAASAIVAVGVAIVPAAQAQTRDSFVGGFGTHTVVSSTRPGNLDQNPYGVAVVRHSLGKLHKGDVLVSNFNNSLNQQGTGTTIVEISPGGHLSLFAQINAADLPGGPGACPGGIGLTTALDILHDGWVVVGSLPTNAGSPTSSKAGCLLVLNNQGQVVETFHGHGINGPWDMTDVKLGPVTELFVTNVLNGTVAGNSKQLDTQVDRGTVLRLVVTTPDHRAPRLLNVSTIGSGFPEELDASALVIGPTGLGLGKDGTLYVADTLNNRIAAIPDAKFRFTDDGTGNTLSSGGSLNGPLGLTIAPNGDVLTVNGGNGNLVEITPSGMQLTPVNLDSTGSPPPPGGAGALFGLAVAPHGKGVYYVDDNTNTLDLLH
jgi:hypothetical protein